MMSGSSDRRSELRVRTAATLDQHWMAAGYAAPNTRVYPWQWLWDSCFHSLIWAELGDDRATVELESALSTQDASGFVPHMNYQLDPGRHADLWGRIGASSITQPPMYGHAVAELQRRGLTVGDEIVARAAAGLRFLLHTRIRDDAGLVVLCHPWESGCDDSPRWDDLCPGGAYDLDRWRAHKLELVAAVQRSATGAAVSTEAFRVASVGFCALVAFNAFELASVTGDADLNAAAEALTQAVHERWDDEAGTWVDNGETASGSGRARTIDGLLPALIDGDPARLARVAEALVDPGAYGGSCGPAGVHRAEPSFSPRTYWRGPAWPQLSYLLWVALRRAGHPNAAILAETTGRGAVLSGLAEYWHPDTGEGFGAVPQCWAGLALLMT